MTVVPLTATLNQYGDYIEQTDLIETTAIDNTVLEATKLLADQAGRTIDTIVRDVLQTGTNVNYCPKKTPNGYVTTTSRSKLDCDSKLRVVDVFKAAAQLKAVNAPTIDGKYVAIIHPHVAFDLMQESGDAWVDIKKYAEPDKILNGELGTLGGVRFVESSEAKIYYGRDLSKSSRSLGVDYYTVSAESENVEATGVQTSYAIRTLDPFSSDILGRNILYFSTILDTTIPVKVVGINVDEKMLFIDKDIEVSSDNGDTLYPGEGGNMGLAAYSTIFLGADAYGVIDINGSGTIEHIVKQRGYGNDPLNQRSSIGWKAFMCAAILADDYILRVESGSSFSNDITEAN